MSERYRMFAAYNSWANERLYDAAAKLSDADYRADRGAFFKSVHGTLNHLLAADRIWMRRFTGSGNAPDRLDAVLCDDLGELREARRAEDLRISRFVGGLDDAALAGPLSFISYRTVIKPTTYSQPLTSALDHFFNHQTHHRGQVHCLLTGIGGRDAAPSVDLLQFQRDTGMGGITQQAP
jgi:uncharacterized damage-inducible protein DinB